MNLFFCNFLDIYFDHIKKLIKKINILNIDKNVILIPNMKYNNI